MPGVRELPTTVPAREALRRAFRLRCPRCGRGVLFDGWFAMRETCDACGLRFEREPGYFVGAIYVNYAVTAVACLGAAIGLDLAFGLGVWTQVAIAVALALLVPVVFFRYSRSLWLGLDHVLTSADETAERRSRKPR